jgi:hypothetical protein
VPPFKEGAVNISLPLATRVTRDEHVAHCIVILYKSSDRVCL